MRVNNQPIFHSKIPFKKKCASGNTVPPRKREKKSTLLVRQQREANKNDAADLGGTGVNPTGAESTGTSAAESTGRPSSRSIPQVNYAEESIDDEEDIDPETYQEPPLPVATTQKHVRISIAVIFEQGSPPQEDWQWLKTIAQICDCLGNTTRSFRRTVSQVCTEVLHCVENRTVYTGDGNYSKSGRPPVIAVDSIEVKIIADSIEGGNSIRMSRLIVNQYRRKFQLPALTYWSVRSCMLRLSPQIKPIKRSKQGSKNKTDAWCQASFRWFAQLLLRFGEIDFSHPIFQKLLGPAYVKEKPPPCYDTSLLTPLKLSQVVWFDELQKQCHIGESGSRVGPGKPNVAISFKRNANGKLDPNGNYPEKGKTVLQVKYEQQAGFNFGVYMSEDGKGHQAQPPFGYTGKRLITRVERNKLQLQAIVTSTLLKHSIHNTSREERQQKHGKYPNEDQKKSTIRKAAYGGARSKEFPSSQTTSNNNSPCDGTAVVPRFSRSSIGADDRPYSFTWPTLVSLAEAYKVDGMDGHEHERAAATSKSAIHDNEESTETETTTRTRHFEPQSQSDSESFDEDILVQETIEAGRGDRDEHGIRDQWESDEHLNDKFDSRKPISSDVLRLLKAYRLECEGCDHRQAVRTVNAYVRETKRLVEAERLARERRDLWARRIFGTLAVVVVSCAFFYKDRLSRFLGVDAGRGARDDFDGFSEAQKAELVRMRREHAARAATQRQQPQQPAPTWLDNEQKEVWTSKQEKQFQTALREFSGVPKKDRYRLIAEKNSSKSGNNRNNKNNDNDNDN
eukprot:jgi/Psemu1/13890/gm1.13890_g